jgi:E3 ubiquitin-protein ligase UBR1/E3 ubiquitin-protein ligase UBR3
MFSSIDAMSQAERNSEQQNEQGLERIREEISEKERTMSAGYESFDELLADLQSSGHSQCTTVWSKDMVAYRCRTCQVNDSR